MSDFLNYAYDRELYQRWLTLYPLMELGFSEYISFEKYKEKAIQVFHNRKRQENISDQEIIKEMTKVVEIYEKQKEREVVRNGNI